MKKSLVIVESPSKAKTINKFLGKDFTVKASVGHIKDLPQKDLGVDIKNKFKPKYVSITKQRKIISDLKKSAEKCSGIYIATDPDREGEAIAWHIANEIRSVNKNIRRAMFNEITPDAVRNSIENPKEIDLQKVDAQQARRVLDRLVGYQVSPILWKTLYRGPLSAGRVQSVALKLICEREVEHINFKPEEYWSIHVDLETSEKESIEAKLSKYNNKKVSIPNKETTDKYIEEFKSEQFTIGSIDKKKTRRNPYPPYITSTLQQDASTRLYFPPSKTMLIAQQLYEGIELGKKGSLSLITYMRTDSNRMSSAAVENLRNFILEIFGNDFLPPKPRKFAAKKKGKIQDAHECIRPTYFDLPPDKISEFLTGDQLKLYKMIWNRAVASQMESAVINQTKVKISAGKYEFQANGSEMLFPGFLKLWKEIKANDNNADESQTQIPSGLKENTLLNLLEIKPDQHFTKAPSRYRDSSLVKELDQLGIGRPSTYATIIKTLVDRLYITREKRTLFPTELGVIVNKILISQFPDIFNTKFTASMEDELDSVESGSKNYFDVINGFFEPFNTRLDKVLSETKTIKKELEEKAGKNCPQCDNELIIKWSKNGRFYACSGFPKCKYTEPIESENKPQVETTEHICEECGSPMVVKSSRYGKFIACSAYPKCKNILKSKTGKKSPPEKAGFECDKCGKDMVIRTGRNGKFYACSGYPKCKNTKKIVDEEDNK
ncbi:type I DNA topoisomerase [candidate division KSB1 bacterium]